MGNHQWLLMKANLCKTGFRTAEAVFKFTPFKETYVNLKQNIPKQAIWNCNEDILDIPSLFQLYKVFA